MKFIDLYNNTKSSTTFLWLLDILELVIAKIPAYVKIQQPKSVKLFFLKIKDHIINDLGDKYSYLSNQKT